MGLLGNLRVRLTAETEDFRRGLEGAKRNLGSFQKDLFKFRGNTLANVASVGALAAVLQSSIDVANQYDNAQRQLAATAKLTGVSLGFLQSTSKAAQSQFRLSAISANGFTIELAKLAGKAGDVGKASAGLEAFLDLGAARGLSADQTLKAVQQSILGIDEGTDKLFSKNPSVLYEEYAKKIGTTAGKLSDQQKAQAILNAAMEDGGKVRGEYQKWLESSQGQQYLLSQGIEQTQATLGKALQPALVAVIPILSRLAVHVQQSIQGWQMLGATLALIPGLIEAAKATMSGGVSEGRAVWARWRDAWAKEVQAIAAQSEPIYQPSLMPAGPTPATTNGSTAAAGKKTAREYFDALESEWERLRHSVALKRVEIVGSDTKRLALEEAHALRLLNIEEREIQARRRLGELNATEYADSMRQLEIRRQLATEERRQMESATAFVERQAAAFERQDTFLAHRLEKERILNEVALTRLGSEAGVGDRLKLQLSLVERTYQIQRSALLSDKRLTDTQLQAELEKLDLAREREQLQLRMSAAAEKELQAIAKAKAARDKTATRNASLRDQALGMAAGAISNGGISGGELGSGLGTMAATLIGGPIATALLPAVGGLLGGLFGKDKQTPVVQSLAAIERATKETVTAIDRQTDAILDPLSAILNLPASFSVPTYMPSMTSGRGSGGNIYEGDTNVSMTFNVSQVQDPEEVKRLAREGVTEALNDGRRSTARQTRRY